MPRPKLDAGASFETLPQFLKDSLNRRRYFWRWDTPEKYDRNMRNYLRMLTGLDRNVGRVLGHMPGRAVGHFLHIGIATQRHEPIEHGIDRRPAPLDRDSRLADEPRAVDAC